MRLFFIVATFCFSTLNGNAFPTVPFTCTGVSELQPYPLLTSTRNTRICDPALTEAEKYVGYASDGMKIIDGFAQLIPIPGLAKKIIGAVTKIVGGLSGLLHDLDTCPNGPDYSAALDAIQKQLGVINNNILRLTVMAQQLCDEIKAILLDSKIDDYKATLDEISTHYEMYMEAMNSTNMNNHDGTVQRELNSLLCWCQATGRSPLDSLTGLSSLLTYDKIFEVSRWKVSSVTELTQKVMPVATGLATMEAVCLGLTAGDFDRSIEINMTLSKVTLIVNALVDVNTQIQQHFHEGTSSPLVVDIQQQALNYPASSGSDPWHSLYAAANGIYSYLADKYSFAVWLVTVVDLKDYKKYYITGGPVSWMSGYGVLNVSDNRAVLYGWNSRVMNVTSIFLGTLTGGYSCGNNADSSHCAQVFSSLVSQACGPSYSYVIFTAPDQYPPSVADLNNENFFAESQDGRSTASIRSYPNIASSLDTNKRDNRC